MKPSKKLNSYLSIVGADADDNELIITSFSHEQAIDSIVLLADSNVESCTITYTKAGGDEYVFKEVISQVRFYDCTRNSIHVLECC